MTPYTSMLYIGASLTAVSPLILVSSVNIAHRVKPLIMAATGVMVLLHYLGGWANSNGRMIPPIGSVTIFVLLQWTLTVHFLHSRSRSQAKIYYILAVIGALLPWLNRQVCMNHVSPAYEILSFSGVMFITIRSLDIIISIRDGSIQSLNFSRYIAYLFFFPTLLSGPVDRYRRFSIDWERVRKRSDLLEDLRVTVNYLIQGIVYKFFLANWIHRIWVPESSRFENISEMFSYMYGYTLYVFFDFGGYSAFAIAFSYLLGVRVPKNFNKPFLSKNVREFWDRWHMSLSWWFRDNIYMRFVVAATKGHWFKSKYVTSYIGFLLTMLTMALWHEISFNFFLYGLYQGLLLVGHDLFTRWNSKHKILRGKLWELTSIVITFHATSFALLIFSGRLFS